MSKLCKKGKSQIRHWKLNWTKAKGGSKAQKKRASRHRAQKESCWMSTWQPHQLTATGPQLMVLPQACILRHISRSCDEFSLTTKKGGHIYWVSTFIRHWTRRFIIPSGFVLSKSFFFLLTCTVNLDFSASLQVGMAMRLSYGQWNLGRSDAFYHLVPIHKNLPYVIHRVFIHLLVARRGNYKDLGSGSLMTTENAPLPRNTHDRLLH